VCLPFAAEDIRPFSIIYALVSREWIVNEMDILVIVREKHEFILNWLEINESAVEQCHSF